MPDLSALIERIEALTGPDDLVDAEIYATIGGAPHTTKAGRRVIPLILKHDSPKWPRYTGSQDAAVALVKRVLPGWWVHGLGRSPLHGLWWCELYNIEKKLGAGCEEIDTAPIALVLAALRALHAQEERR